MAAAKQSPQDKALKAAQAQHPEAPPAEVVEPNPVMFDKDSPKPEAGDGKTPPETPVERAQQEAMPVAQVDNVALGVGPGKVTPVPIDPPGTSDAQPAVSLSGQEPDPIAVGVGLRSPIGERTGGVVDEKGKPVKVKDVLDMGDGTRTTVLVTQRVFETFYLPGSFRPLSRLLFAEGAVISRKDALALTEAVEAFDAA